jgi:hypothetical protein
VEWPCLQAAPRNSDAKNCKCNPDIYNSSINILGIFAPGVDSGLRKTHHEEKIQFLVCATIVATHWAVTGNAQIGPPNPGESGAVYTMTNTGQLSFHTITSAGTNVAPLDTALTADGLFIYTLDGAAGSISEFRLDESSQTLTLVGTISDGLTGNRGMQGMAARWQCQKGASAGLSNRLAEVEELRNRLRRHDEIRIQHVGV